MDFNQEKKIPASIQERKKLSPSTVKRNSLRKKAFLAKKAEEKQAEPQLVKPQAKHSRMFKCNQCETGFISTGTLDSHMMKEHI